jgi:tetratricopeptide (TPR) repeat protein
MKPFSLKGAAWVAILVSSALVQPLNGLQSPQEDARITEPYINSGLAKQAKGDLDGAIADFNKAIELAPAYTSSYWRRAEAKKHKGDFDGAIADYTKAIELVPAYHGYYHFRGRVRQAKGDLDEAIADYTKSIELSTSRDESRYTYADRGEARKAKGDVDGAIADFTRAVGSAPANRDRSEARRIKSGSDGAKADQGTAAEVESAKQAELARLIAKLESRRQVDLTGPYNNSGLAKQAKGDLDGAIADFNRAIELAPAYSYSYGRRAEAKKRKGDLDGAIADYNKAIALDPADNFYYHFRGRVRQAKGDLDGAIADFTKSIELSAGTNYPAYPAYKDRSQAKQAKGDLDGAKADNAKALKVERASNVEAAKWLKKNSQTSPSGPPFSTLPRPQVAILKLSGLGVVTVDGIPPPDGAIRLQPGQHTIRFARHFGLRSFGTADIVSKDVTLDAGKTYTAKAWTTSGTEVNGIYKGTWDVGIRSK